MKLVYSLVKPDDPILRQKATPIEKPNFETIVAYDEMVKLLKKNKYKWLALAAPQIGSNQAFFVSDFVTLTPGQYEAFINPQINWSSPETIEMEESCVSIPHESIRVPRSKMIVLQYTNMQGVTRSILLSDIQARVAQHEADHLEGKLITDYR